MATHNHMNTETLKSAINYYREEATSSQKRNGNKNGLYMGNPIKYTSTDSRLQNILSREEYYIGFALGLIGNNGHDGTILKNASNIDL